MEDEDRYNRRLFVYKSKSWIFFSKLIFLRLKGFDIYLVKMLELLIRVTFLFLKRFVKKLKTFCVQDFRCKHPTNETQIRSCLFQLCGLSVFGALFFDLNGKQIVHPKCRQWQTFFVSLLKREWTTVRFLLLLFWAVHFIKEQLKVLILILWHREKRVHHSEHFNYDGFLFVFNLEPRKKFQSISGHSYT